MILFASWIFDNDIKKRTLTIDLLFASIQCMEHAEIQQKCEKFLEELGIPGFIVFGWKKDDNQFGIVHSYKDTPPNAAIKGLVWVLNDFINRTL